MRQLRLGVVSLAASLQPEESAVSYRSILVNIDIDAVPTPIVKLATDLARRFDARLIGVSAADVPPPIVSPDGMVFDGELLVSEREGIKKRLAELQLQFHRLVAGSVEIKWHGMVGNPTRLVVEQARAADLVVTSARRHNGVRSADTASVTLEAGRPVLVVADNSEYVLAKTVLIAWKDTREARRAVADALPLLATANEVVVATINAEADTAIRSSLDDVLAFLKHHKITARGEVISGPQNGQPLLDLARSAHADLIVAGAYGHSRLREWAFGGVTRTLLDKNDINRLMSY
jgi:nucleotide-binding universal stress UspA family protein